MCGPSAGILTIPATVNNIISFPLFRLTFQFSPSSKVYGFSEVDLVRNGGDKVFVENARYLLERFSNECRKTKTKEITMASRNNAIYHKKLMISQNKYI